MSFNINNKESTIQSSIIEFDTPKGLVLPVNSTELNSGNLSFFDTSPVSKNTDLDISYNKRLHISVDNTWCSVLLNTDLQKLLDYSTNLIQIEIDAIKAEIEQIKNAPSMPRGLIFNWGSTVIPNGLAVCDGRTVNGLKTPDLRNRFVIGSSTTSTAGSSVGFYPRKFSNFNINDYGGSQFVSLQTSELPKHQHIVPWGEHWKEGSPYGYYGSGSNYGSASGADWDNTWRYMSPEGSSNAHNNLPPFRAITYVMVV